MQKKQFVQEYGTGVKGWLTDWQPVAANREKIVKIVENPIKRFPGEWVCSWRYRNIFCLVKSHHEFWMEEWCFWHLVLVCSALVGGRGLDGAGLPTLFRRRNVA